MYGDQFGEFVCGYWGFKGKKDVKVGYKLSTFVEIFYQTKFFEIFYQKKKFFTKQSNSTMFFWKIT